MNSDQIFKHFAQLSIIGEGRAKDVNILQPDNGKHDSCIPML